MQVAEKHVVSIHFTLKDDEGEVLESSNGGEPLTYLHGSGGLIPGLEKALVGRKVGDKFQVVVPPEQGYGERDEKLLQRVPKNQFPEPDQLEEGMQFQVNGPRGPMVLTVLEIADTDVVVDGNPELAGETLHFDIEVTEVRPATADELAHGHAHGPGGHHHHD
jgi:FKBP-type peptidyl-prolyl cis-trans isomerase SlyD